MVKDLQQGRDLSTVGSGTFKVTGTARVNLGLSIGEGRVLAGRGAIGAKRAEVVVDGGNDRSACLRVHQ